MDRIKKLLLACGGATICLGCVVTSTDAQIPNSPVGQWGPNIAARRISTPYPTGSRMALAHGELRATPVNTPLARVSRMAPAVYGSHPSSVGPNIPNQANIVAIRSMGPPATRPATSRPTVSKVTPMGEAPRSRLVVSSRGFTTDDNRAVTAPIGELVANQFDVNNSNAVPDITQPKAPWLLEDPLPLLPPLPPRLPPKLFGRSAETKDTPSMTNRAGAAYPYY